MRHVDKHEDMIRRTLGSTDMTIAAVGFGAWAVGGWLWGEQDDRDSIAAIEAAVESGINWIDTAPIYGSGRSERVVGEALKRISSDRRPFIFTKFGVGDDSDKRSLSASRDDVLRECEASLQRLGVERIDLYQQHWPASQPIEETASACAELLKAGKIRAVGVCNYSIEQLEAWRATKLPLHALQTPYSVMRPASGETVLPWCEDNRLGGLAYSPLFRGMLFGTWTSAKKFAAGDSRAEHKDYRGTRFARHLQAVDEFKTLAADSEQSCAQLCIGALMCTPGLTACIIGARNREQGLSLGELGMPISGKQLTAIEEIIERLRRDLETIQD